MNKLILFLIAGVVVILIGWSLVQPLQTPDGTKKDEIVQVSGGSYRNIASEQLWIMLQKKDFVLINVHIDRLPQDKAARVVLYCMSGRMSAIAADTMVNLGYTNVLNLKEGMRDWQQKGYSLLNKP